MAIFLTIVPTFASEEVPVTWSEEANLLWAHDLPGSGSADPVIYGDRIYLVGYQGYGEELVRDMNQSYRQGRPMSHRDVRIEAGDIADLEYWIQARDLNSGALIWERNIPATEKRYPFERFLPWHGYASASPAADAHGVVAFFGPEGVFAFDHEGVRQWRASVGKGVHRWGSGSSPVIVDDLVVVNAYPESQTLFAFDRATGKERWRRTGIEQSWATPAVMQGPEGPEILISMKNRIVAWSARDGRELWASRGIPDYAVPTPVIDGEVAYVIGGRADFAFAVERGGEILWEARQGSNVSSPVLYDGYLYFADDQTTHFYCLDAETGETLVEEPLARIVAAEGGDAFPMFYADPVVVDGRIHLVSRQSGTFVLRATPPFDLLAHNFIESDDSIWNATPAVQGNRLYLRSGGALYCVGGAD